MLEQLHGRGRVVSFVKQLLQDLQSAHIARTLDAERQQSATRLNSRVGVETDKEERLKVVLGSSCAFRIALVSSQRVGLFAHLRRH